MVAITVTGIRQLLIITRLSIAAFAVTKYSYFIHFHPKTEAGLQLLVWSSWLLLVVSCKNYRYKFVSKMAKPSNHDECQKRIFISNELLFALCNHAMVFFSDSKTLLMFHPRKTCCVHWSMRSKRIFKKNTKTLQLIVGWFVLTLFSHNRDKVLRNTFCF